MYDYSQSGFYFVTICAKNRAHLFGEIKDGVMILNEFGRIARDEWIKTETIRENITVDAFVIMPNHVHGIIEINNNDSQSVGAYRYPPLRIGHKTPFRSPSNNLGAIVRGFKSAVTKQINKMRSTPAIAVWQRNYHEHIVRDEESLHKIREYIAMNPELWGKDRYFGY